MFNKLRLHLLFTKKIVALCALLVLSFTNVSAQTEAYTFNTPEQKKIFNELLVELSCPQCQNSNLSESSDGLSENMRAKIFDRIQRGDTKIEIIDYMVDRYGSFIVYTLK